MPEISQTLEKIIQEIVEKEQPIAPDADLAGDLGMESIEMVELYVAVQKTFGVKLPENLYSGPKSISSLTKLIQENR